MNIIKLINILVITPGLLQNVTLENVELFTYCSPKYTCKNSHNNIIDRLVKPIAVDVISKVKAYTYS